MKPCIHCGETKPLTEFYRHDGMADSYLNTCKECVKAAARANRAANPEHYKEYDRQRAFRPDRVAARKAYQEKAKKDPNRLKRDRERITRWKAKHALKRKAHVIAGNAIRDGGLIKQPCERCSAVKGVQAHHEDYSKPLDVNWLCRPCHGLRHREINAAKRAA